MRSNFFETVTEVLNYSTSKNVAFLNTTKKPFNQNKINTTQGSLVNFSFSDYLGLSSDERIMEGAIDAIRKNGVNTSISRSFLKLGIYEEAESILSQIFNKPVLLLPKVTLGHIAALPVIIGKNDAVILDQYVHKSVQLATDIMRSHGIYVETIRHNNLTSLQDRINHLKSTKDKIWYLTDSIYSMRGDSLPIQEIEQLLNTNEQLYLYVDDAHGMSWAGENGQGFLLSKMAYHPKLFLTTSFAKGFGTSGGVLICPDEETKNKISIFGAPLMFTSPIEPAVLGSIIASSKIHLSPEINERQERLATQMRYFYKRAKELHLPVVDDSQTPIALLGAIKPHIAIDIGASMFKKGFHITGGVFPAVSYNNAGLRISLNLHQSIQDIEDLLQALVISYKEELSSRSVCMEDIFKHFKILD